MKNISALTHPPAAGVSYPAYVSVNEHDDSRVSITVRSEGESDGSIIYMARAEFASFLEFANKKFSE